jgi:hypothetical protein
MKIKFFKNTPHKFLIQAAFSLVQLEGKRFIMEPLEWT